MVDVELKMPPRRPVPVISLSALRKDGKFVEQGKVDVTQSYIVFAKAEHDGKQVRPVTGDMQCTYVVRRATGKTARTVVEGDDEAVYVGGETAPRRGVELIPAGLIESSVWYLETVAKDALHMDGPAGETSLQFASYPAALDFKVWAREHAAGQGGEIRIGNYALLVGPSKRPLTGKEATTLRIGVDGGS